MFGTTRRDVIADHAFPVGVGTLRSFRMRAISRADLPASSSKHLRPRDGGLLQLATMIAETTELLAAGLGRGQRIFRSLRDHATLLLRQRSIQVKHKRIGVGAEIGNDERDLVLHQAGDDVNVAARFARLAIFKTVARLHPVAF
jgi:hypothetical protein